MKALLLAATMFAAPVLAQTEPPASMSSNTGTPPAAATDSTTSTTDMTAPAPATDPAATSQPMSQTSTTATTTTTTGMAPTGDPVGGYQPATMPTAGTFQPSADPSTAYPAPAPLASYPVCKKGQYDKCIERSTPSGARHPSQPR